MKPSAAAKLETPTHILTHAPSITDEDMPPEVALLLPTHSGAQMLIDLMVSTTAPISNMAVGMFMSDPFLDVTREAKTLSALDVSWVCNLPTVEQHEEEFTQQLADVGLDRSREYAALQEFKSAGLKVVVAISSPQAVHETLEFDPDALIVIPRASEFAAGFPSPRQRGAAAQSVRVAIAETSWSGALLGYGDEREADHMSQWPDAVDGMLFRPDMATLGNLAG